MKTVNYKDIYIGGELNYRACINFERLNREEYTTSNVFKDPEYNWPGDFEGRAVLGLALLAQSTHKYPTYLDEVIVKLPEHLNEKGYIGKILPDGIADEQQISGHSWLLRGLIEYYTWKKDVNVYNMIKNIVYNFLIPLKGCYLTYPSDPAERILEGGAIGNLNCKMIANWYPSSDIGCAFIMLDGATHAYELMKEPLLGEFIDEMVDKFLSIDVAALSFQTHATLSALRGLLRYYNAKRKPELLDAIKRIYMIYFNEAITENFANYNWFGRPTWTEPCAVIDSFIIALGLWENTGESCYLKNAHHIFFNAIGYAQRPNGGFGCDLCAGAQDEFLAPKEDIYEAYWCCSMRGGEGLSRAAEYLYLLDDDALIIPFYSDSIVNIGFTDGNIDIKQTTGYPVNGQVRLDIINTSVRSKKSVKMYMPGWVKDETIKISINSKAVKYKIIDSFIQFDICFSVSDVIELVFNIEFMNRPVLNKNNIKGCVSFYHGVLLLGVDNNEGPIKLRNDIKPLYQGDARYINENTGTLLSPVNNLNYNSSGIPEIVVYRKQVLFKQITIE